MIMHAKDSTELRVFMEKQTFYIESVKWLKMPKMELGNNYPPTR
jgi:hypothetical protein